MLIYQYFENKSNANEILLEILILIKWGMFMEKSARFFNMKEAHFIKLEFLKYVMKPRFFEKYLYIRL